MIGGLITTAKFGWAAVTGVDALVDALAQYAVKVVLSSREVDAAAAAEIVSRAQAAVPQDTGLLFSGITYRQDGETWIVRASAIQTRGRYEQDYAFLVEHGTAAGVRGGRRGGEVVVMVGGRSRAGAFNEVTGRRYRVANAARRSDRTHPGTRPQPYFYPAVDAVLGERAARLEAAIPESL